MPLTANLLDLIGLSSVFRPAHCTRSRKHPKLGGLGRKPAAFGNGTRTLRSKAISPPSANAHPWVTH